VFVIVLENESAATTFGQNSAAPYLPNYYGIGHNSNDNYIAMISGQAPNVENQADCILFANFLAYSVGPYGQERGPGCVYPVEIQTIANQLDVAGLTWRDYDESMGATPSREPATCGHPTVGGLDGTQSQTSADQYASRHNPFVYFHAIIDLPTLCARHVVNLDMLPADLESAASTPNYVFITPGLCSDGHDATCKSGDGKGGLGAADAFLQRWVPQITDSPAFRQRNGLLIVTFDESETSDSSACCGEIAGPGSPLPGISGPGGGRVGAVLLSPCIAPGTVSQTPYNHYTMLRSVEDIFGLGHLGYAQLPGETTFGPDIFTRQCAALPRVRIAARARGRRVRLRWRAAHTQGPPAVTFSVQVRRGRGKWHAVRRLRSTTKRTASFTGRPGARYRFRVRATDGLGRIGPYAASSALKLAARRNDHRH
jgi:hypothetical protein